ncbi:MAG: hypothetical protein IPG74_07670 [Flavobacteriales bacterium]|nr:hypothetical protein [Flavobacteriales bacterium]MBK7555351.1 hypothetical protein [Flavobacteriales bacterium]MBK9195885.1 hypothetical protein [Flavobacteriales bacterium]MBP6573487.1 hypothetical protein [Flavobacteriales bacterium]
MTHNIVQYEGQLSSEVRIQLLDLLKVVSLANLGQRNDLKKLCGIALELLDNAQRYNSAGEVSFEWRIEGNDLVVLIRNRAAREDAERLIQTVKDINAMSPEQVTAAFRAQLTNEQFGAKGGAGLGMLQIAKKTGSKLEASCHVTEAGEFVCTSRVAAPLS